MHTHVEPYSRLPRAVFDRAGRGEPVSFDAWEEILAFTGHEIIASKIPFVKLAKDASCCWSTVANIANGRTASPQLRTVIGILQALGYAVQVRK